MKRFLKIPFPASLLSVALLGCIPLAVKADVIGTPTGPLDGGCPPPSVGFWPACEVPVPGGGGPVPVVDVKEQPVKVSEGTGSAPFSCPPALIKIKEAARAGVMNGPEQQWYGGYPVEGATSGPLNASNFVNALASTGQLVQSLLDFFGPGIAIHPANGISALNPDPYHYGYFFGKAVPLPDGRESCQYPYNPGTGDLPAQFSAIVAGYDGNEPYDCVKDPNFGYGPGHSALCKKMIAPFKGDASFSDPKFYGQHPSKSLFSIFGVKDEAPVVAGYTLSSYTCKDIEINDVQVPGWAYLKSVPVSFSGVDFR